ncbi:MAG: hypothetical protein AB7F09_13095 [Parvibaculaceae bacterium]
MMLAIFVFFVGQALTFRPDARAMPLLIGVPAILLCILQIVFDLHDRRPKAIVPVGDWPLIAWLAVFFAGILAFGFAYGAPPLVAAYLYFAARERLAVAVAGGVFCVLMLSFGFEKLLYIQLFEGLITPLLF